MIQIEQYGFDEDVELIIQPYQQFLDYNETKIKEKTDKDEYHYLPRIFKVQFSRKYFIPAENLILINFKPVRNANDRKLVSPMGLIKYRLWYQETINLTDKLDRKNQIVYRKGSPEIELYKNKGETDEKKDEEKEDDKTKDDDDKNPNDNKVDDNSKSQNET